MKFTVIGVVTCIAEVEVEADTFEEAIRKSKEQCLTGNPIEAPDFDVQSVERRQDLEEEYSEEEDVSERIEENESICSQVENDSEEYSDADALELFKKLWLAHHENEPKCFKRSEGCKQEGCKCKKGKRGKGVLDISVYDAPLFWGFND